MNSAPDDRTFLAYHEAGHAVASQALGFRIGEVTIAGGGRVVRIDDLRHTTDAPLQKAKRVLLCALAGPLSDTMLIIGRGRAKQQIERRLIQWDKAVGPPGMYGDQDFAKAFTAADFIAERVGQPRRDVLDRAMAQLHKILDWPPIWSGLEAVAKELLARETIDGHRVAQLCSEALPPASGKRPRLNLRFTGDVDLSISWVIGDA